MSLRSVLWIKIRCCLLHKWCKKLNFTKINIIIFFYSSVQKISRPGNYCNKFNISEALIFYERLSSIQKISRPGNYCNTFLISEALIFYERLTSVHNILSLNKISFSFIIVIMLKRNKLSFIHSFNCNSSYIFGAPYFYEHFLGAKIILNHGNNCSSSYITKINIKLEINSTN